MFSHGELLDNRKIEPFDRKLHKDYVPIIMYGTQSYMTVHTLIIFYYILYTKNFGSSFLQELVLALKEHPTFYAELYTVRDTSNVNQIAVRHLFNINLSDRKFFPQNQFRLFVRSDPVRQPLDVFLSTNQEMVAGKINLAANDLKPFVDRNVASLGPLFDNLPYNLIGSVPMFYNRKKPKLQYGKKEDAVGFLYPFGLYKTNSVVNLDFQKYYQGRLSHLVKEIVQSTHEKSLTRHPKRINIGGIFVFCCKASLFKILRNLELPQEQAIEMDAFHLQQQEGRVRNHLKTIETKRRQRMRKKKQFGLADTNFGIQN